MPEDSADQLDLSEVGRVTPQELGQNAKDEFREDASYRCERLGPQKSSANKSVFYWARVVSYVTRTGCSSAVDRGGGI